CTSLHVSTHISKTVKMLAVSSERPVGVTIDLYYLFIVCINHICCVGDSPHDWRDNILSGTHNSLMDTIFAISCANQQGRRRQKGVIQWEKEIMTCRALIDQIGPILFFYSLFPSIDPLSSTIICLAIVEDLDIVA